MARACAGALQGVPCVAHEAYSVPDPVDIASNGYSLPMLDTWEPALGSWKRERNKTLFTYRALKLFLPAMVAVLMVSTQPVDARVMG